MKTTKILAIIAVIVVVALAVMYFRTSSGAATSMPAIVTPMPTSDYSIEDSIIGGAGNGFPQALPESLPPIPGEEADVMTGLPMTSMPETTSIPGMTTTTTAAPELMTTMAPTLPAVDAAQEGFMAFAPKNFRGDIL